MAFMRSENEKPDCHFLEPLDIVAYVFLLFGFSWAPLADPYSLSVLEVHEYISERLVIVIVQR